VAEPTNPVTLDQLDPPILEQTQFGDDMKRWLSNIVDVLNADLQILSNALQFLIQASGYNIPGGMTSFSVPVTGLTSSGFVTASIVSTTMPDVTIASVTPALNAFTIVFSADPGASVIVYQAYMEEP